MSGRPGRPGRRPAWVGAVLVLLVAACQGGGDPGPDPEPAGPEPVELSVVALPDALTGARFPHWAAGGERILFSAKPDADGPFEVMSVAEDGSDLRCLSCGAVGRPEAPLLKAIPFPDGRRIAVRVGEQSPLRPADHGVLECRPSVADCRSAQLVAIEPPAAGDAGVVQDQRELRVAPDGETVGLSQVRRRGDGEDAAIVAVVGRLERAGDVYRIADARVVSPLGELKGFTPDGRHVLVAAFTTLPDRAANGDVVRIELATGEQTQVTVDGDYDEDISFSPDQRWYAVASARGSGLFETVSQLRRPNFLGPAFEPLTAYLFAHHRADLLEPWLVGDGAEQGGERGQQLNPDSAAEGYDGRTLITWHPAGDRILFSEDTGDPFAPAGDDARLVVAHLTSRTPGRVPPVGTVADPSPVPRWAPALGGYAPPPFPLVESRSGAEDGTATVTRRPAPAAGQTVVEVVYDGFTDDGEWIVDGTETATYDGRTLGATAYAADLTLSGDHTGWLRADAVITVGAIDGTITSSVDGRELRLPVR